LRSLSISLEKVEDIRVGRRGEAVISAVNRFGGQTYVTVHCLDIPKIVGPLLSYSAMDAKASLSEPVRDTIIRESDLPVLHWQMGQASADGGPVLVLTLAGGTRLALKFPPQAAQRCGKALEQAGAIVGSADVSERH
jgi:hypothetical protein